jgi:hypothetical protein
MPTLLWRVLSYVGYPDGMEPRYFWANERLGEDLLVTVEAAERAAFGILRDIIDHFS